MCLLTCQKKPATLQEARAGLRTVVLYDVPHICVLRVWPSVGRLLSECACPLHHILCTVCCIMAFLGTNLCYSKYRCAFCRRLGTCHPHTYNSQSVALKFPERHLYALISLVGFPWKKDTGNEQLDLALFVLVYHCLPNPLVFCPCSCFWIVSTRRTAPQ